MIVVNAHWQSSIPLSIDLLDHKMEFFDVIQTQIFWLLGPRMGSVGAGPKIL